METTTEVLRALTETLGDQYAAALAALPMKKQVRETLIEGYRAGLYAGAVHTARMLGATIKE